MKKDKTKLVFTKETVTELTDVEIRKVNGGCQWGDSSGGETLVSVLSANIPTVSFISFQNPTTGTQEGTIV